MRRIAFAVLVLIPLVFLWTVGGTGAEPGRMAPTYAASTLEGDSVDLAGLRGRVVVLNVWATWCAPCIREMPALQRIHEKLADRGLSVVAVSVDVAAAGADEEVRAFVDRFDLTFTVLRDASGRIEDAFGVAGLPTTFIIDRDGRIQRKILGAREWDDPALAEELEALLAE